ncbi:MAG: hypothetical protein J3Q66DRAFT_350856 [Benniella sp.]|nr:MAG: hypothetical protein J3Q66DRAFT_350856 [Benniella sp.]
MFWPWLFRRCGQVEKLGVPKVHGATQLLTHAMLMHMPRITEIAVGVSCETLVPIPEHEVATLLSGSSKGWKTVKLGECASFGRVVMEALAKHFSTLEALKLNGSSGRSGNDVIRILCSCPCLRSFIIIDSPSKLDTMVFVDQDPVTGVLRPWECETTLKELKIKIAGVSRASFQTYTRQGYDLESRLYDRLARLTNLEILWIGDYDNEHDRGHLEMSLESGLSKLSGLRLLRELNIEGLATRIRVKEVQWMVEKWPRLRTIYGLQAMEWDEIKTRQWVWEHHPEIELGPKWYQNLW